MTCASTSSSEKRRRGLRVPEFARLAWEASREGMVVRAVPKDTVEIPSAGSALKTLGTLGRADHDALQGLPGDLLALVL